MLPVIDRFRADYELFRGNDVVSYAGTDGVTRKPVRITRYMASPGSSTQILKQVRSVRSRFTTHIHAVHHEPKRRIFSVVEPAPCCTAQLLIDLLYANPFDRVVLHEELIWEIAAASITALAHLADQGLTHMGISPGAIHLTEMGPRLACPRLSRTLLPEDVQNMDIQTLQFTAPEVIAGRGYIPQSDLWSLGATLYACCTGKPPAILQTIRSQEALETAYFDVSYDVASHISSELASLIISLLAPLAGVRPKLSQLRKHPRIQTVIERLTAHASFTDQYLVAFSNLRMAKMLRSTHGLCFYNPDQFGNYLCFTELMRSALFPCTMQLQEHTEDTTKLCDLSSAGLSFDTSLLGKRNVFGKTALLLSAETQNLPLVCVLLQYESALLDYRGANVLVTVLSENWEAGIARVYTHLVDTSPAHLEAGYTRKGDSTISSSDIEGDNRYTPLMLAALHNDIEAVWRYSDKFEGMRDASERTALFHAVENGFLAIARLLATREAGLTSDFGNTALRLCAERNMPATAALCYKEAGILYSVDQDRLTAVDIALANQNYVVASVLVKHDVSLNQLDLFQAIEQHDISTAFRRLLGYVISGNSLKPLVDLLKEKDLTSLLEIVAVYTV